ncbi:MAG: TonB C-terminal domain-containing protein [Terriglobales bacterium]
MPLLRILADPEDDTIPPPPPMLRGGAFPIDDLLLDLHYERQRAKRQRAVYLSIIVHLLLIILILLSPRIFRPVTIQLTPEEQAQPPQLTYLELPPDLITKKKPKQPKALSDRDRHFEKQTPIISSLSVPVPRPALRPQPASPPPGPAAPAPRPASPRVTAEAAPQPPKALSAGKPGGKPAPETGSLELQNLPKPATHPGLKFDIGPADIMKRAIQGAVQDGARGQQAAEIAPLPPRAAGGGGAAPGQAGAGVQILSDTEGVDFSSYLQRVLEIVRRNWYAVMPETVYLGTKGRVVIVFNINANGSVPGINPVSLSGTHSLDQAAEASIHASNPFPPLPPAFHGPFIKLQFSFYYNITPPRQ